jgi:hypothetical protein
MPGYQVRTSYDVMYDATRAEAQSWAPMQLTLALRLILMSEPKDEVRWGAVDAISDLLGQIVPPGWRQEMW